MGILTLRLITIIKMGMFTTFTTNLWYFNHPQFVHDLHCVYIPSSWPFNHETMSAMADERNKTTHRLVSGCWWLIIPSEHVRNMIGGLIAWNHQIHRTFSQQPLIYSVGSPISNWWTKDLLPLISLSPCLLTLYLKYLCLMLNYPCSTGFDG